MSYKTSSPVLLILFNRVDRTEKLISALSKARPERLYVAIDGPRPDRRGEVDKCNSVIDLLRTIDWPCEIFTKISESNIGAAEHIPSAVDWLFQHEKFGVILEDDCIPSESFFRFVDVLGEKYEKAEPIMWINGTNVGFKNDGMQGYVLSSYPISWGWASWARAWALIRKSVRRRCGPLSFKSIQQRVGGSFLSALYWRYNFDFAYSIRNWDFRVTYALWIRGGYSCTPMVNLIRNIGNDPDAHHGGAADDPRFNIPEEEMVGSFELMGNAGRDLDHYLGVHFYRINILFVARLFILSKVPVLRSVYRRIRKKSV